MSAIKQALEQYSSRGVNRVIVEFSGGGGDGVVDGIAYFMDDKNVTKDFVNQWAWSHMQQTQVLVNAAKYDLALIGEEKQTPEAVIEDFAYENSQQVDWQDDGGGYGKFVFTYDDETETWAYDLEIHVYVTESELAYSRSEVIA